MLIYTDAGVFTGTLRFHDLESGTMLIDGVEEIDKMHLHLRREMRRLGLSQRRLVRILRSSKSMVFYWITGKVPIPTRVWDAVYSYTPTPKQ